MNTLAVAQMQDFNVCNDIINMGKEFQREQGFVQWTNDYPNKDTICNDINSKTGNVVKLVWHNVDAVNTDK